MSGTPGLLRSRSKHEPAEKNVNSFTSRALYARGGMRWATPAWPPPITSVSTCSTGSAASLAARGGAGRGADDPAPERGEIALLGLKTAIDQIPAHALGHAQRKRRDQPSSGEIVVDIGPDPHRNPQAIDRGLQRVAVILKLRSARRHPGDT